MVLKKGGRSLPAASPCPLNPIGFVPKLNNSFFFLYSRFRPFLHDAIDHRIEQVTHAPSYEQNAEGHKKVPLRLK
jgi:hypothetical protein